MRKLVGPSPVGSLLDLRAAVRRVRCSMARMASDIGWLTAGSAGVPAVGTQLS